MCVATGNSSFLEPYKNSTMEDYPHFSLDGFGTATLGYCNLECPNFILYIILFSIFVFIHSTSEVGSMLLILRCVDPRDKAMALGLIQFAIGLFGNVPCSIVYGAVVDSACLIWKMACGEKGACGLYDSDVFRMSYHGKIFTILTHMPWAVTVCIYILEILNAFKFIICNNHVRVTTNCKKCVAITT